MQNRVIIMLAIPEEEHSCEVESVRKGAGKECREVILKVGSDRQIPDRLRIVARLRLKTDPSIVTNHIVEGTA